jgi:predicted porin
MYDILEIDNVDGSDLVIGADYEIAKDVKTYAEFSSTDRDSKASSDEKLVIGARVYF